MRRLMHENCPVFLHIIDILLQKERKFYNFLFS